MEIVVGIALIVLFLLDKWERHLQNKRIEQIEIWCANNCITWMSQNEVNKGFFEILSGHPIKPTPHLKVVEKAGSK